MEELIISFLDRDNNENDAPEPDPRPSYDPEEIQENSEDIPTTITDPDPKPEIRKEN